MQQSIEVKFVRDGPAPTVDNLTTDDRAFLARGGRIVYDTMQGRQVKRRVIQTTKDLHLWLLEARQRIAELGMDF
jgi:hypothetical protein